MVNYKASENFPFIFFERLYTQEGLSENLNKSESILACFYIYFEKTTDGNFDKKNYQFTAYEVNDKNVEKVYYTFSNFLNKILKEKTTDFFSILRTVSFKNEESKKDYFHQIDIKLNNAITTLNSYQDIPSFGIHKQFLREIQVRFYAHFFIKEPIDNSQTKPINSFEFDISYWNKKSYDLFLFLNKNYKSDKKRTPTDLMNFWFFIKDISKNNSSNYQFNITKDNYIEFINKGCGIKITNKDGSSNYNQKVRPILSNIEKNYCDSLK